MKTYFFYAQIAGIITDDMGNFVYTQQPTNKKVIQYYGKMKPPNIKIYKDTLANKLHRTEQSSDIKPLNLQKRGISDVLLPIRAN